MNLNYILFSALLGFLAFFEPCTIASHLLFSERVHRKEFKVGSLFYLWLTRFLLLSALLLFFNLLPLEWSKKLPFLGLPASTVFLGALALVYLVSRKVYLPVPHLEFFRLWPRSERLPQESRLGLSLPACTIPLFLIVALMSIELRESWFSLLLAFSFASLFSLPVWWVSVQGITKERSLLFSRLAATTPFLTAVLLFLVALGTLGANANLSKEALEAMLQKASFAGLVLGFLAGFVFSFNPVSFASIPVMLAYVTGSKSPKRAFLLASSFVVGLILTHIALGLLAALSGKWVASLMGRHWGLVLSPILFLLALNWLGVFKLRIPWIGLRAHKVHSVLGAFLLSIPFSIAVCPFCAPALLVLLVASASIGSVFFGMALLFSFALGRSIPILIGAWSMGFLESLSILKNRQGLFEKIGGLILLLSALYLLNEYFLWIIIWT